MDSADEVFFHNFLCDFDDSSSDDEEEILAVVLVHHRLNSQQPLFNRIREGVVGYDDYFECKEDAVGKIGFSSYQKCTAAI